MRGGTVEDPKPSQAQIHRDLREEILLLDLPPGTRLREVHLAHRFGVSRTPIRQVLFRLEFEGLVEIGEGRGAQVSALDPKSTRDTWALRLSLAHLVGDYVRLPAPPQVVETVIDIRAELESVRRSKDLRSLGRLYNRFHEAMLELVGNSALRRMHDLLYVQTARVWMQFLPDMDLDREIDVMAEEVDDVLGVMRDGTAAELASVREMHMRRLLTRFNTHATVGGATFPTTLEGT